MIGSPVRIATLGERKEYIGRHASENSLRVAGRGDGGGCADVLLVDPYDCGYRPGDGVGGVWVGDLRAAAEVDLAHALWIVGAASD